MKRVMIGSIISLLFTGSVFAQTLGAVLTGSQETPPCATPGFGNATVTFDSTRQNINVNVTVANLGSPITASHIHNASTGGNVVLAFTPAASFSNGTLSGTFPITSDLAKQILSNPANFYVNVHTSQCPGGAIRGNLASASGGRVLLAADMRGSNETPPNSSTGFGAALVTIDPNNPALTFDVIESGLGTPTLAHIHPGAAGASGSPLITFASSASAFTNGRISGSVPLTTLDPTQFNNLITTPANFYVNVHSSVDPGGEIRGQLQPAQELDIPAAGHVTNGIGQTFVSDVRVFNPSFTTPASAIVEYFPSGTTANANAPNAIVVNLAPRGTAVLNDVAGTSGLNVNGVGAIRIASVQGVVATSRIYINTSGGSFGQFIPAFPRSAALRHGAIPQVSNTSAPTGLRANLGLFNPNSDPVTVRIEARDATGSSIASNTITLAALSQQQNALASYFPGVDLSNLANATVTFDAASGVFAYVSEVDNTSGDSFFVPAQPDNGVAANQ